MRNKNQTSKNSNSSQNKLTTRENHPSRPASSWIYSGQRQDGRPHVQPRPFWTFRFSTCLLLIGAFRSGWGELKQRQRKRSEVKTSVKGKKVKILEPNPIQCSPITWARAEGSLLYVYCSIMSSSQSKSKNWAFFGWFMLSASVAGVAAVFDCVCIVYVIFFINVITSSLGHKNLKQILIFCFLCYSITLQFSCIVRYSFQILHTAKNTINE